MTDQDSGRQPRSPRDADLDAITVSRDTDARDRATRKILTDDTEEIDPPSSGDGDEPKGTSILEEVPRKSSPPHPADIIRPVIAAEKAGAARSKPPTSTGGESPSTRQAGPRDPDRVSVRSDRPGGPTDAVSAPRVGPGPVGTVRGETKPARTEVSIFDIEPGESTSRAVEDITAAAGPDEPSAFDLGPSTLDELHRASEPPPTSEMPAVSVPDPDEIRLPTDRSEPEAQAPTTDEAEPVGVEAEAGVADAGLRDPAPGLDPVAGSADVDPRTADDQPIADADGPPNEPIAELADNSDGRALEADEGDLTASPGAADDLPDATEDAIEDLQALPDPSIDPDENTAAALLTEAADLDPDTTDDTPAGLLIDNTDLDTNTSDEPLARLLTDNPGLDTSTPDDTPTTALLAEAADLDTSPAEDTATALLAEAADLDPDPAEDTATALLTDNTDLDPDTGAGLLIHGSDLPTDGPTPGTDLLDEGTDAASAADPDTDVRIEDGADPTDTEPQDDAVADDADLLQALAADVHTDDDEATSGAPSDLLDAAPPSGAPMIPAGVDVDAATATEQATVEQQSAPSSDRVAAASAVETLEFRQIAGLTAGNIIELTEPRYDFAETSDSVGFSLTVDEQERVILIPGDRPARVDSSPVEEPVVLGSGVLDVGTARFVVRSRRGHKRATDWLDEHRASEQPPRTISVPSVLPEPSAPSGRRRRGRKKSASNRSRLDPRTQDFIDEVRHARAEAIHQQRFQHPDPSEMSIRVRQGAPVLGIRSSGHDLFAKVGVIMADMPWLPSFDDIHAIPEAVGLELQPMLFLPSVPVAADLLMGPLGIVGSRSATIACARQIMISLHALSTNDLRLHVVAGPDRHDVWDWAAPIAPERPLAVGRRLSVVVVDGMENYGSAGFEHDDAVERRVGVVVLATSVDELPSYCGTVLQVDSGDGGAVLTDHEGSLVAGTPIGMSNVMATEMTTDLVELLATRAAD